MRRKSLVRTVLLQKQRQEDAQAIQQALQYRPLQPGETIRPGDEEQWASNEAWSPVDQVFIGRSYTASSMPDIRRKRR